MFSTTACHFSLLHTHGLQELSHQDIIRQLKLEHGKEVTKLRQEFELQVRCIDGYKVK
jgi:hypothetical protein